MRLQRHRSITDGIDVAWTCADPAEASGEAPVVVLHGLGSSSREFLYLADHPDLRHRTLVFIDLPGFGDSDRPEDWTYTIEDQADLLATLLREIASPPVALVGHSMGGSIAIVAAARHPGLVERLVVAEPNLDPGTGELSGHIARQTEAAFVARGYRALVYQTSRQAERGDGIAARFLVTLRQAAPIAVHRSAESLRAGRSPTFREQLESLAIPRTLIWGEMSPPLNPALDDAEIARATVEGAAHTMMAENPDGFASAIHHAIASRRDA